MILRSPSCKSFDNCLFKHQRQIKQLVFRIIKSLIIWICSRVSPSNSSVISNASYCLAPDLLLLEWSLFRFFKSNENAGKQNCGIVRADRRIFFIKFLEDISPFCRATDTPVFGLLVTSAPGFKARVDPVACMFSSPPCNGFLRFTSGVTPANLLGEELFCFHFVPKILQINFPWCHWTNNIGFSNSF